jgi:2-polyprenyl-3-methyl-5-hydroxy-6-metoxy-1,4-benzoquinol methylase
MNNIINFNCPKHNAILDIDRIQHGYQCPYGCFFPIISEIPRFVPQDNYAASFGLQWNKFRTTQLDSFSGLSISKDRLARLADGSLEIFKGKKVLEAGCGAGRFTEIMLSAGATVFAADLSEAVEANYKNCSKFKNYFVCQADLLHLPVSLEQFDIVVCIGVIQHTPDPEKAMAALCSHVKPGGLLIIDHYTYGYPVTPVRRVLRSILLKTSKSFSMKFCQVLTHVLWPIHIGLWKMRGIPAANRLRSIFLTLSPLVDYQDAYPQLSPKMMHEWAMLDTHDTLTDVYKHLRSVEEIETHLLNSGMTDIIARYAGNGVEAMAKKPEL